MLRHMSEGVLRTSEAGARGSKTAVGLGRIFGFSTVFGAFLSRGERRKSSETYVSASALRS